MKKSLHYFALSQGKQGEAWGQEQEAEISHLAPQAQSRKSGLEVTQVCRL